jgi:hypothetical protein
MSCPRESIYHVRAQQGMQACLLPLPLQACSSPAAASQPYIILGNGEPWGKVAILILLPDLPALVCTCIGTSCTPSFVTLQTCAVDGWFACM